ncbi:MAG: ATP-binding protein [Microcoleaceae cyanobacterium]
MANLLLIHSSTDQLIHLKDTLKDAGYQVAIADTPETALSLFEQSHRDLIICAETIINPADGIKLCQTIKCRSNSPAPYFIIIAQNSEKCELILKKNPDIDDSFSLDLSDSEILARVRLGLRIYQLNQNFEQAKSQLLQNEKTLSIGQMVSGIAHEINNPVSLITGNISHATEYTQDLLEVMQLFTEKYPEPEPEIEELIEEVDLEYLIEDLPQVLNSMKSGADRIRQLVQSLRNFYQADDDEKKLVDIHAGIEDILLILKARLKGKQGQAIEVIEDYGELENIECYPGQLNQVFMNVLNNAIDVLNIQRSQDKKFQPTVWIKTEFNTSEKQVRICIKDNGLGMSNEIKEHIFEPFFTTKTTENATGLGLSLSRTIITENHGGTIKCVSKPEEGTEFIIEIPVNQ